MKDHPVVMFDGVCNYCNAMVNFVIREDKQKVFQFAALQSDKGQELLKQYNLPQQNFNSFVLIDNGKAFTSSTAGLKVINKLPWYWRWGQIFWIVPAFIRDGVYNIIAKNRYKWFGKKEVCMIPTPDVRNRFLS